MKKGASSATMMSSRPTRLSQTWRLVLSGFLLLGGAEAQAVSPYKVDTPGTGFLSFPSPDSVTHMLLKRLEADDG